MKSLDTHKIAIVTLAVGEQYQTEVALGIESKRQYCREHGYDFILADASLDPSRHIYWSKILLVLKALEETQYTWIVWMDADTLIMNHNIRLEDFLDEGYRFIISEDCNGINAGIFFIKNCGWSHTLMKSVYARTDCISHIWPEQQAIALELENHECSAWCKLLPQRLFNSYASELFQGPTIHYEPGDFLLHFASANQLSSGTLKSLFQKYALQVIRSHNPPSLDAHLSKQGFRLSPIGPPYNEGYITDAQRQQFEAKMKALPQIEAIAEIGLNTGHSADFFFKSCGALKKFVSFDINQHAYTCFAVEYLSHAYKDRFEFIEGDSIEKIPEYAKRFPSQKFDLIYIDGNHTFDFCFNDLMNCKELAHKETKVWVDDYHTSGVKEAVLALQKRGILNIDKIYWCEDMHGVRCWAEMSYTINSTFLG